jgi:hypothetical protein
MNARTLGLLAIIGAPFLFIDMANNGFSPFASSSLSGFFNLAYMSGWICSIIALKQLGAFGRNWWGQWIFRVQIMLLLLAAGWAIYQIVQPNANTTLYYILDACWPLSNLFMLLTGITVAIKSNFKSWQRFVPLAVGLWLPLGMLQWALIGRTPGMLLATVVYSAVAWTLMGIVIIMNSGTKEIPEQELALA